MLWSLAYCQAAVGEYQKAIDNLSHRSIGQHTNWVYAYCYARSGQLEKANEILQYHIERSKRDHVPDFMMAVMYASVGEKKKAMEHLRISVESEAEHWFLLGMKNDPMLKSLQEEPGFQDLLEKSRTYYSM